jgi:DNA-binding IclR family transcriptional regulator
MPVVPLDTETRTAELLTALADLGPGRSASPADLAIACGCSGSTARSVLASLAASGAVAEWRDAFGPHYTLPPL